MRLLLLALDATLDVAPDVALDATLDVAADVATDAPADAPEDAAEAGVIPVGQRCATDYDCVSSACDSMTLTCVVSQCDDHRVDGAETDVDCGGPCPTCATGKVCKVDDDCSTFACDAYMHACVTNACDDHRKDYAETDVDCGGSTCPACAFGKACFAPSDCATDICDALMHVCISNQCEDHTQDGTETDVDCGGSCCFNGAGGCCSPTQHCKTNFDCVAGHLCNGSMRCQ